MSTLHFTKGHGTGNDFVLYTDPEGALPLAPEQIAAIAHRRFGVGADGVIRAVRSSALADGAAALAEDPAAEWFMDYHNADGSTAEMCGNGIRVYVRYLVDNGLVPGLGEGGVAIGTRAGVRTVRSSPLGYEVDLGRWTLPAGEPLVRARNLPVARPGLLVDVGNPHVVVALPNEEELAAADLTVPPLVEPGIDGGVNVEFVVPGEPLVREGVGRIRMRVHERGSGETLSCGTGAAAAALATRHWAGAGAPDSWLVDVPGGLVGVRVADAADGSHVLLDGPAELVFDGVLTL